VAREPCQKGTSVLPVVAALKAHPDGRKLVPPPLWKYFDDHLLVSAWYPERDYFTLLEALVKTIDAKAVGGDVWRYFAKFSVKRDIAGSKAGDVPSKGKGVYRNFGLGATGDPDQLFRRGVRLWSQYHDTGTMRIVGKRAKTRCVVMQLAGFHIPIEGFVRLQGYYLEEFGKVVGVELASTVTRSTARGSAYCEWEHALDATHASETYLASLPPVP
jgi:hypothetical protein